MEKAVIMIDAETRKVKSREGFFVFPVVNIFLAQKCQFLHLSQRGSPARLLAVSATKRGVETGTFSFMVRFGVVGCGQAWSGRVRCGRVWYGLVRSGVVWSGEVGLG